MDHETVILSGAMTELAESTTYIELTTRVCFYDAPNLNNVRMLSADADRKAQTLVNMPVVAKYRKNALGQPDLGGHECYKDPLTGEILFGTENIGTHVSVEIKEDLIEVNGELLTLPCLFAVSRIWKRNKNVVAAIRRLFAEKKLFNSWEILCSAYTFDDGVKTLVEYVFESNCLLGTGHQPAGGTSAAAIDLASIGDAQLMVAEALETDLINAPNKEEQMDQTKNMEVQAEHAEPEVTTDQVEEQKPAAEHETATLTEYDLRTKIREACRNKLDKWCWLSYHFPVDRVVWMEVDGRESELDYVMFTYTVGENDTITLSEPTDVKLTVSIAEVNSTIASKDDALVAANEKINELSAEITALLPYKESAEQAERERIEAETAAKRTEFAEMLMKTKLFTKDELETAESIKNMIDTLDQTAAKSEIAERFMKSLEDSSAEAAPPKVETAELVEKVDLHGDTGTGTSEFMRSFLGR